MYRKYLYLLSLVLQGFLVIVFSIFFGYALGVRGDEIRMSDYIFGYFYFAILIMFTIYHYRSPYHSMKSALYLFLYYASPAVLVGLFLLLSPSSTIGNIRDLDALLLITYGLTGLVQIGTIFGKEF